MKKIKKIILGCSCILFLSISNVAFAKTGTVTGKTVRIRESADSSSNIITNAYRNDNVEIIEDNGDWYKVNFEGKTGYISKEYVEVKESETTATTENENSSEPEENTPAEPLNIDTQNSQESKITILKDSNLKLLPNFSSRNLGLIPTGTEIEVKSEVNNWVQIVAGSNTGWILKNNVSSYSSSDNIVESEQVSNTEENIEENTSVEAESSSDSINSEDTQNQKAYINTDTARVRETAGGKIIGNLDEDDVVTILGEEGDWYKITCDEYSEGYVSKSLITIGTVSSRSLVEERKEEENAQQTETTQEESVPEPTSEVQVQESSVPTNNGNSVVEYAKSFLGSRYVSGGSSPSGFDCSGFTQYIFSHFGYSIERVASGQASNGVEVSRDNLQPGDLLIFQDSGRTSIGHVGIYIGNGDFIHAANPSRGVVIDNINSNSYYNVRYVTARRIM